MSGMSLASATSSAHSCAAERTGFSALPALAQIGVVLVSAAGLCCAALGVADVTIDRLPIMAGLLLLSLLTSTARIDLPLTSGGSTLSWAYITNVLSILLVGPWSSVPIALAGAWCGGTFRAKGPIAWYESLFSMGTTAMSVALSGLVYHKGLEILPTEYWTGVAAAAAAASVYFLLDASLPGSVMTVSARGTGRGVPSPDVLGRAPSYYIGAALAFLVAEVAKGGQYWWAVAFALPMYLIYRSYRAHADRIAEEHRQVCEMSGVHLAMVEALALAIEAKDNTSQAQVTRIQVYSEGLARALSMTENEVRGVKTAALLHDIGNLAVPEHILSKPGRLTYEEYDRLKIHPRVGADIIKSVPFPYPVAPLVLAHHERWDGRGYPAGIKGRDIPVGARILSVVDCFTSMLTERPYRPSHTYAEAIATLRENGGSTLDPDLVEKFIEILPAIEAQLHTVNSASQATAVAARENAQDGPTTALEDIAVAHREEHMLRDIGQSLSSSLRVSDALSLISTRLVSMMPLDACALFLVDPDSQLFMCSHVVGSHQDAIRGTTAGTLESLGMALPSAAGSVLGTTVRLQSLTVAPLVTERGTIGALAVYHTERNPFTPDHRRLLTRVAAHAANVIANALVFEQAQEQSLTDVLTGLPNRRYLDQHLGQEVARVQRHGGQLSVLVLDMDGFKQINDEFGHQAGDSALKEVSQVLRASLRVYDVCARFAGDEFVLVLGDCGSVQAERRRVDLQRAISALWVEPLPGRIVPLAVSIGAATLPDDADTVDRVISVADQRMYRDKAQRKRLGSERDTLTPDSLWH